jgi:glycosyltransferase involved in cell wall biosynthesis
MTILFLDQFNQPGGAQQCLLDLIPGVLARGWKAAVMLPGEGILGERLRAMGVDVLPIACGSYNLGHKTVKDLTQFMRDARMASRQIAACISDFGTQTVYVNGPRLIPAAVLAAGKTRLIFHCHSLLSPRYLEWVTALPLRFAKARVIASSRFVAVPLQRHLRPEQIDVIYNGVPFSSTRPCHRDGLRIGIIGRVAREKGQDMFLQAARILHRRMPGCTFVICGAPLFSDPAYGREVRELARGLPVEFTGWVEDVAPVLCGLDLLVVPSAKVDATPRVILEAFAAKVPVVAFANEGFRELIADERTGFLVERRTADALAQTMESAFKSGACVKVADAAFREWQMRFSVDEYRRRVVECLEQLI